jgi:hypothetical protein
MGKDGQSATPAPPETWLAVAPIPAVVSQDQFDQAQAKLAQNQQFARRHNTAHSYLLRALVSCGVCQLRGLPAAGSASWGAPGAGAIRGMRITAAVARHTPSSPVASSAVGRALSQPRS